ncbi:MAG: oxygen-independent coproporphyrinogen III oxidase [Bacteroidetes bacterium]|nr:oxygen-independent coproporphyrinogen III oxidase [Bacteroidota bacterium]
MQQFNKTDISLMTKYNKQGPRYTSYPTAPMFSHDFDAEQFKKEIISTNGAEDSSDLSLYMHFPYCDTLCYFCGCTMLVTRDRDNIKKYNEYIIKEIDLSLKYISKKRKVSQLHWGGGSPSYLEPFEIRQVGMHIKNNFTYSDDIEASVEIDPRGLTREHMQAFRDCGFNRISMGVQDFNEDVQKAVNRIQPENITMDAINWSRELGFESINLDLIYGLPFQTYKSFETTLDKVIEISPDRIAVFNYAHVPWIKKHMNLIKPEDLPSPEEKLRILEMTINKLIGAGYWYIGMDHFAKPGDELAVAQKTKTLYRNFQGYSTKAGCDVYAYGMSAISQFRNIYAQNHKDLKNYYEKIDKGEFAVFSGYRMTKDDHIRKKVIMDLMCHLEVNKKDIEKEFGINFNEYFAESLKQLKQFDEDKLVTEDGGFIRIAESGKLIIRNSAMCFDAYLDKLMKEKPIFSKTV